MLSSLREPLLDSGDAREGGGGSGDAATARPASTASPGDADTEQMLDMLYTDDSQMRTGVDLAPLTVSRRMKLARISYVLRLLGASSAVGIDEGRFLGVLTRVTLFRVEANLLDQEENEGSFNAPASMRRRNEEASSSMSSSSDKGGRLSVA